MERAIDIDELWRVAARKLRVPAPGPQDLYLEALRALASSLESAGRYDAAALRLLQREIFARILADLSLESDLSRHPEIAEVPVRRSHYRSNVMAASLRFPGDQWVSRCA